MKIPSSVLFFLIYCLCYVQKSLVQTDAQSLTSGDNQPREQAHCMYDFHHSAFSETHCTNDCETSLFSVACIVALLCD
jgi:hypothetical protein